MSKRQRCRMAVDLAMTVLLFVLMASQVTGQFPHEWTGAAMFALFIAHHALNLQWFKGIFKGTYNGLRLLQTVVDALLFVAMLALMVSGPRLSRYVFPFFSGLISASLARLIHLSASAWAFVLMGVHLGLHWGALMGTLRKVTGVTGKAPPARIASRCLAVGVGIYGGWAFWHHKIGQNLFLRTEFAFFDAERPIPLFVLDHIAMMGLFVLLSYGAACLLRKKGKGGRQD